MSVMHLNVSSPTLTLGSALWSADHPHVAASKTVIEVDMTSEASPQTAEACILAFHSGRVRLAHSTHSIRRINHGLARPSTSEAPSGTSPYTAFTV